VRILRPIVVPKSLLMPAGQSQTSERGGVGAQLVGDDKFWRETLLLEQLALSTSGPPMAAPTPISRSAGVVPKAIATKVTTLSGSAVPNAARIVPVAVWLTLSRAPTHSTPFTKNLQDR